LHNLSCTAIAPLWVCGVGDLALYLIPSAALAVLIAILARIHPLFFIFTLAGTICHELAHLLAGLLVGARPVSMSIMPKRLQLPGQRTQWRLGFVSFTRLRWYNAAPAALAPFVIVLIPLTVAWWRTRGQWHFGGTDLILAVLLAPQWLSFWPSATDWRLAARSWPLLVIAILAASAWVHFRL
jgi:hypothetical protein